MLHIYFEGVHFLIQIFNQFSKNIHIKEIKLKEGNKLKNSFKLSMFTNLVQSFYCKPLKVNIL